MGRCVESQTAQGEGITDEIQVRMPRASLVNSSDSKRALLLFCLKESLATEGFGERERTVRLQQPHSHVQHPYLEAQS